MTIVGDREGRAQSIDRIEIIITPDDYRMLIGNFRKLHSSVWIFPVTRWDFWDYQEGRDPPTLRFLRDDPLVDGFAEYRVIFMPKGREPRLEVFAWPDVLDRERKRLRRCWRIATDYHFRINVNAGGRPSTSNLKDGTLIEKAVQSTLQTYCYEDDPVGRSLERQVKAGIRRLAPLKLWCIPADGRARWLMSGLKVSPAARDWQQAAPLRVLYFDSKQPATYIAE